MPQKICHPERSEGSRLVTLGTSVHGILRHFVPLNDRRGNAPKDLSS